MMRVKELDELIKVHKLAIAVLPNGNVLLGSFRPDDESVNSTDGRIDAILLIGVEAPTLEDALKSFLEVKKPKILKGAACERYCDTGEDGSENH